MKRQTAVMMAVGVLLVGAVLLCGQSVLGQAAETKPEKRTITTAGTATIKVKPDSARVFFGVQTVAPTLKAARQENGAKVSKVMDALKALKIPDLKMKSSNVQVSLVYSDHSRNEPPKIVGYQVTHTFTVLVKHEDQEKLSALASRVLDTALENGANMVEQIVFFKEDESEVKREALAKAVEDAAANAKAIAGGARVNITDTVNIYGEPQYYYGGMQMAQTNVALGMGMGGEAATPLVAGDLEVTCRVNVTCTF